MVFPLARFHNLSYRQFCALRCPACCASASLANVTMFDRLIAAKPGQPGRWYTLLCLFPRTSPFPLDGPGGVPDDRACDGGCTPVSMAITGWISHPVSRQLDPSRVFVLSTCQLSRW